jgi:hypothetical protein
MRLRPLLEERLCEVWAKGWPKFGSQIPFFSDTSSNISGILNCTELNIACGRSKSGFEGRRFGSKPLNEKMVRKILMARDRLFGGRRNYEKKL